MVDLGMDAGWYHVKVGQDVQCIGKHLDEAVSVMGGARAMADPADDSSRPRSGGVQRWLKP